MPGEIDIYEVDSEKILKEVLVDGVGDSIPVGASVTVHYKGTLLDGTAFDSSRGRSGPFKFKVGVGNFIAGWDIGICSMKKKEHSILTIHPKYAFGLEGNPLAIPPNATVKFEVEIIDWEHADFSPEGDGSIKKIVEIKPGTGYLSPKEGDLVKVHIHGKWTSVIEDRDVLYHLGSGQKENVAKGIERALLNFKLGEKSTIVMKQKHTQDIPNLEETYKHPHLDIEYDIELKFRERSDRCWSMEEDDLIQHAEMFKEKGNQTFTLKDFENAITLYTKMQRYLVEYDKRQWQPHGSHEKLLLSCYLNLALCHLKLKDNESAKDAASKAVDLAPDNIKAHYRYGLALFGLSDFKKASDHFQTCLKIDPDNKEVQAQLDKCKNRAKMIDLDEKGRLKDVFSKMYQSQVPKSNKET